LYHHLIRSKMKRIMSDHISIQFDHCGIEADTLAVTGQKLQGYITSLHDVKTYGSPEGFLVLPEDHDVINRVIDVATEKEDKNIQGVIVIGIGGSNLGTMAIASALRPRREILFLETADPLALQDVAKKLHAASGDKKHYITILISKSGTTTESIANFGALLPVLQAVDSHWQQHIVVVTDEGSALWMYAESQQFSKLAIPQGIGGRFSVFSPVGLLPLLIAGISTTKILQGAAGMKALCLNTKDLDQNPALMGAAAQYLQLQEGKSIHNLFLFAPHLEPLGKWWRQLVGESLSKEGKGITPMVSIGSTDLHSMGQLYFGGPQDIMTTILAVKDFGIDMPVSAEHGLGALVPDIEGKKLGEIMAAIRQGVRTSYVDHHLPFVDVQLGHASPENLGAFMQWKMMETIYLAQLLGVNAFDQPAVEHYKKETRAILAGK
jgi:glucose-6-phosphate isomerase